MVKFFRPIWSRLKKEITEDEIKEAFNELRLQYYSKTFEHATEQDIWDYMEEIADMIHDEVRKHGIKIMYPISYGGRKGFVHAGIYDEYNLSDILVGIVEGEEGQYELWAEFKYNLDDPVTVSLIDLFLEK